MDNKQLRELADVQLTAAPSENNKILAYSSALDKFILKEDSTGKNQIRELTDTMFPTLDLSQNDKVLFYDGVLDVFGLREDRSGLPDAPIDG